MRPICLGRVHFELGINFHIPEMYFDLYRTAMPNQKLKNNCALVPGTKVDSLPMESLQTGNPRKYNLEKNRENKKISGEILKK